MERMIKNTIVNPTINALSETALWKDINTQIRKDTPLNNQNISQKSVDLAQARSLQKSLQEQYNFLYQTTLNKTTNQKHDITALISIIHLF